MENINVQVLNYRFRNSETRWSVAVLKDISTGKTFVGAGAMPEVDSQDILDIRGDWVEDPKYGRQLNITDACKRIPTTPDALARLLTHDIDGCGKVKSNLLVKFFGAAQLRELLDKGDPEPLTRCYGISPTVAARITESWQKNYDPKITPLKLFLSSKGLSSELAPKLVSYYGSADKSIEVLSNDPFDAVQISGIGFETAKLLAEAMGIPSNSLQGVSGRLYEEARLKAEKEGNSYVEIGELQSIVCKAENVTLELVEEGLQRSFNLNRLVLEEIPIGEYGAKLRCVYLPYMKRAEEGLARRVAELQRFPHQVPSQLDYYLEEVQKELDVPFSPKQVNAIRGAFANHVAVITGPPGTGKTTVVRAIVRLAKKLNLEFKLAAPTGRAAKRLAEVSESEASTIHRMLGIYDPENDTYNRSNPLPADVIIVDETSMLDTELGFRLFDAIPDNCSVILVGDVDQLPSVGPGMVLKDLIQCGKVHVTILDQIFRQALGSTIIQNAHLIRAGRMPQFPQGKEPEGAEPTSDTYFIKVPKKENKETHKMVDDVEWVQRLLVKLCSESIPQRFHVDPIKDVQILMPMRQKGAGVHEFNDVLQKAINPHHESVLVNGHEFRVGDRVMQFKNNYRLDVFNGDIGFIQSIDPEDKVLKIQFYDQLVEYPFENTSHLQLAYAQTIHKSQGSEFPVVVIVLLSQHYTMLNRNLIYTASTRAKRLVIYVSSTWAIQHAVENVEIINRKTNLSWRILRYLEAGECHPQESMSLQ